MSVHDVAIVSFQGAVAREVKKLRNKMKQMETESDFYFNLEVSGRLHDGDLAVRYEVGGASYDCVKGHNPDECLSEFLRRKGWQATNQPLMLTSRELNDEVPD